MGKDFEKRIALVKQDIYATCPHCSTGFKWPSVRVLTYPCPSCSGELTIKTLIANKVRVLK